MPGKSCAIGVEFAIKLPGKDEGGDSVLLPIDAKFPHEDYDRLLNAQDKGQVQLVVLAGWGWIADFDAKFNGAELGC